MTDVIRAPWTPEQVAALNRFQEGCYFHPFTCGTDGCRADLVATPDGWKCPRCSYAQDWAHPFMADDAAMDQMDADPWRQKLRVIKTRRELEGDPIRWAGDGGAA